MTNSEASDWEYDEFILGSGEFDPDSHCWRCQGCGEVPTADHESYTGLNYKPCPDCDGTGTRIDHDANR